jgi:ketosteroid isomerase-like protein
MDESPATVVRRLFERYRQAGVEGALELIAPDFMLVVPPEASAEPDTYEGHAGARRYFDGFEGVLEEVGFELLELEEVSTDTVITEMKLSGRGAATGIRVEQLTYTVLTVRDGLVTWIMPFGDRASARRAIDSAAR